MVENNVALDNIGNEQFNSDERVYYNPGNTEIVNLSESECCSFIIQEKNGETIYAFRQDGKLNGNGIQINSQSWNGLNILKQEIDDVDDVKEYFFHTIITENGWVIGQGGSQYDGDSRFIEQMAATMVLNNDIINIVEYQYGIKTNNNGLQNGIVAKKVLQKQKKENQVIVSKEQGLIGE